MIFNSTSKVVVVVDTGGNSMKRKREFNTFLKTGSV